MSEGFAPRVQSVEVESYPNRTLRVDFDMANPFTNAITGLELWLRVRARFDGGHILVAEGRFGKFWTGDPPGLFRYPAGSAIRVEGHIPLSNAVLAEIERCRAGDVGLEFTGEVTYSISHRTKENVGHEFMGERRRTAFTQGGTNLFHKVAQSEWLKHLAQLRWQDTELLEVPRHPAGAARLGRAYEKLQEASKQFRNGHWDSCMQQCKKAYEAALKDATGLDDMKKAAMVLQRDMPAEKKEKLDALLLALGDYTHLARHEGLEPIGFGRQDAALCFFMTSAVVDYVAAI